MSYALQSQHTSMSFCCLSLATYKIHGCLYTSRKLDEHNAWANGCCVGSDPDDDDTTKQTKPSKNLYACTTSFTSIFSKDNWDCKIRTTFMFYMLYDKLKDYKLNDQTLFGDDTRHVSYCLNATTSLQCKPNRMINDP